uniref:FCF1 rRNA-processing protein n=2 Tax=Canis lupus familiaris TaxID=9615 RepID=A0A8I3ML07_CANLF
MGKQKKTRKYATMKRMLSLRDQRLKEKDRLKPKKKEKKVPSVLKEREVPQHASCLFFQYNTQLGPPYHILVDTNFVNFSFFSFFFKFLFIYDSHREREREREREAET